MASERDIPQDGGAGAAVAARPDLGGTSNRQRYVWAAISVIWVIGMVITMIIIWPRIGSKLDPGNREQMDRAAFRTLTDAFIARYRVGEADGVPVVSPPPGSDVYIEAARYTWRPILQLERGATYRLLISSVDVGHTFAVKPGDIDVQVDAGYITEVEYTPPATGEYSVICTEYCGSGHHEMVGRLTVVEPGSGS